MNGGKMKSIKYNVMQMDTLEWKEGNMSSITIYTEISIWTILCFFIKAVCTSAFSKGLIEFLSNL